MSRKPITFVLAGALGFLTALPPARASDVTPPYSPPTRTHWYVGAGITQLALHNDHPSLGSDSGSGLYLTGGIQLFDHLSFELNIASTRVSTGATCDPNLPASCRLIYYPADSAEYFNLMWGLRLGFPLASYPKVQPWVTAGFAYHSYGWDNYWYYVSGSGHYLGGGVDVELARHWGLRLDLIQSNYDSADNYGDGGFAGSSRQFDAAVVFKY